MSAIRRAASLVAVWLALITAAAHAGSAVDVTALKAFPCPSDEGYVSKKIIRHCGYLRTTERADGTGRPIDLAVVVLIPPDAERAAVRGEDDGPRARRALVERQNGRQPGHRLGRERRAHQPRSLRSFAMASRWCGPCHA